MSPNVKHLHFWLFGVTRQLSDWSHLASQLFSHLYQCTYKIWKQSMQDALSYHVHEEVSADVDVAAAA